MKLLVSLSDCKSGNEKQKCFYPSLTIEGAFIKCLIENLSVFVTERR